MAILPCALVRDKVTLSVRLLDKNAFDVKIAHSKGSFDKEALWRHTLSTCITITTTRSR
jgi:hypothetical protein